MHIYLNETTHLQKALFLFVLDKADTLGILHSEAVLLQRDICRLSAGEFTHILSTDHGHSKPTHILFLPGL